MKNIHFKNLQIKNFMSVGDEVVEIDFSAGVNFITGKNLDRQGRANGSGKSVILDALHYSLYGETIREIKKEFIVNNVTKKNGSVTLEFNVESGTDVTNYIIKRSIGKTSKILLMVNGEDKTLSTLPENDKFIKELIGYTPFMFQSCVGMSANNTTPFMSLKKSEKKLFVEGIMKLEVFAKMLADAKADYSATASKLESHKANIVRTTSNIELLSSTFISNIDTIKRNIAVEESTIKELTEKQKILSDAISKEDFDAKLKDLEKNLLEANESMKKLAEKVSNIEKEIAVNETKEKSFIEQFSKNRQAKINEVNSQISALDAKAGAIHTEHINKIAQQLITAKANKEGILAKLATETLKFSTNKKEHVVKYNLDITTQVDTFKDILSKVKNKYTNAQTKVDVEIANLEKEIAKYSSIGGTCEVCKLDKGELFRKQNECINDSNKKALATLKADRDNFVLILKSVELLSGIVVKNKQWMMDVIKFLTPITKPETIALLDNAMRNYDVSLENLNNVEKTEFDKTPYDVSVIDQEITKLERLSATAPESEELVNIKKQKEILQTEHIKLLNSVDHTQDAEYKSIAEVIEQLKTVLLVGKQKQISKNDAISAYNVSIEEIKKKIVQNDKIKESIRFNEHDLKIHNDRLVEEQKRLSDTKEPEPIVDLKKKLQESTAELVSIEEKCVLLGEVKEILSETGVKSFVIKRIIDILNEKINYYLDKFNGNCVVTFDEAFDDTIVNERGESVTYFNFSGAERKNIDLACLFAFQDIRRMQGDVKLNISFFDELLDSSFDSTGIELILSVLKDRVDSLQEAVYIITHRTTPPFEYGGKLLTIVKKNGISQLE